VVVQCHNNASIVPFAFDLLYLRLLENLTGVVNNVCVKIRRGIWFFSNVSPHDIEEICGDFISVL
jgi:hypothetical protein